MHQVEIKLHVPHGGVRACCPVSTVQLTQPAGAWECVHLGKINHRPHIVGALKERDTALLAAHNCNGSFGLVQVVLGEGLDERLDQGAFAAAWRTLDYNHKRGRVVVLLPVHLESCIVLSATVVGVACCSGVQRQRTKPS